MTVRAVSAKLVQRLSAAKVRAELNAARAEPGGPVLGGGAVRYGVAAYDVRYRTVDADGQPVVASGLVAFPGRGPARLPVVSYDHGTTATRIDVPSLFGLGPDHAVEGRWTAELFASAGFAVTEPDYVGMGTGTGPIQYLVARSLASASADLLVAARTLSSRLHRRLERGALISGFSEGGAAAARITGLFDGSHSDESDVEALPSKVGALLTPKFLGLLKHPRGHFLRLIRANSTCWTPPVPVRL